jgi:hypothetical protein
MGVQDDWYFEWLTQNIRKSQSASRKAAVKAADTSDAIRDRARTKELKELQDKMRENLESIRKDLALDLYTRHVDTTEWQQRANEITVVASNAVERLTALLKEVEREVGCWSARKDRQAGIAGINALPFPGPEGIEWRQRRATAIARILADMKKEQDRKDHELMRGLIESWLKCLASAIGALISERRRYEQLLRS